MHTSEPLHVAFVWHMHQPYYRSARTGVFGMPWARMHALKDYLNMVEILSDYPDLHQTFNLVPSLVEQLEDYASGEFADLYWNLTLKPADELTPTERAFVVERMCERSGHPRARAHARYLEIARKREADASGSWEKCAETFTVDELRDLQIWFNLAWFDPHTLLKDPLAALVERGRDFTEQDKAALAEVQADIISRTLPAYRDAAARSQIEISTSPYFHPILPLLINSDSARIAASDTVLPPRRFAHPEDAAEQIERAVNKHQSVFGRRPLGMWCSEQAVGEDVIPFLIDASLKWTISDETVLVRSLTGAAAPRGNNTGNGPFSRSSASPGLSTSHFTPYRLPRGTGEIAIVFRDHTLSDLIGFAYQSWASRDAAMDLLQRLRDIRSGLPSPQNALVTIALDGENAWEYYPRDGRDFLQYLYEGLTADPSLRCVTVSEHLSASPPTRSLGWLHTGSWIGGDLRTWSGDRAHNIAWDLLLQAREVAAAHRPPLRTHRPPLRTHHPPLRAPATPSLPKSSSGSSAEIAWRHILIAEGSDWFWWFGDHHRTELDYAWDLDFRIRLQEVYRVLGEEVPTDLFLPILEEAPPIRPAAPRDSIAPVIDGRLGDPLEWRDAGSLAADTLSTMHRSHETKIEEVRFGGHQGRLCLLIVPHSPAQLEGLEVEVRFSHPETGDEAIVHLTLEQQGRVGVSWRQPMEPSGTPDQGRTEARWEEVLEIMLPPGSAEVSTVAVSGLVVRIGRDGLTEHVYHSAGLPSTECEEQ